MNTALIRPYLSLLITIFFFSTIEVAAKLAGPAIDPIFMALIRFLGAGLILGAIGFRKILTVTKSDFLKMTGLGLLGVTLGFSLFHTSLHYMPASTAAVIFSINPVISAITASIRLKEHLNKRLLLSMSIGIAGVYLVVFGFARPTLTGLIGPLLMIGAAATFAIYTTLAKPYTAKYGSFAVNGVIFLTGSVLLPVFVRSWVIENPVHTLLCAGYLMLFATTIAYVFFFWGLSRLPISAGSSVFYLKPVIASVLSVLILNEQLNAAFYSGLGVILVSLLATGMFSRKPKIQ